MIQTKPGQNNNFSVSITWATDMSRMSCWVLFALVYNGKALPGDVIPTRPLA